LSSAFDDTLLKKWFIEQQRDLPWRDDRSPYSVWVSEMMLQQTQVSVVIPYYQRWMERFPTIQDLAKASLDEVIKLWEGLGYYSRARYLHQGARYIVDVHGSLFPSTAEELQKIKGLGAYTIGALLSFAFHQRTAAVDGNVIRVLSRYFLIEQDVTQPKTLKMLQQLALSLLPDQEPWIFNEALIELGATLCTRHPTCRKCPLKGSCRAYAEGAVDRLPYKAKRVKIEKLYRTVAIIKWQNALLVKRGQPGEIMSDLHEFPYFETDEEGLEMEPFKQAIWAQLGLHVSLERALPEETHSYTRYRVSLHPFLFSCIETPPATMAEHYRWCSFSELDQLAFSSGHRRVLATLQEKNRSKFN
jgi:A/G-specific adenine glycosylase